MSGGEVRIEGYASLWARADLNRDVVARGAFTRALERAGPGAISMLYQHETRALAGQWDEVREDDTGLFVRGGIMPLTPEGRMAAALTRAGVLSGLSIGFRTLRARRDGPLRVLSEIDLWEVSLVVFPMEPKARYRVVSE